MSTRLHIHEVAKRFPRADGKPRCRSTIIRWILNGCRSGGRTIKLTGTRAGGSWYTTDEAVGQFERALTEAAGAMPAPEPGGDDASVAAALEANGL